jgi:hypothetical protein
MGLVKVTVDYSSPDVTGPNGEDRRGKVWGELVPYGLHDLGFKDCRSCPWRVGANENTVFTTSHDIMVEGKPLPAGAYGVHMIVGKDEWTVIFSRRADSWGSYFYDPALDQLRVQVKPVACAHQEWLTFEFGDRRPDRSTLSLRWEQLELPLRLSVPDADGLYMAQIRREMAGQKAFQWINLDAAAQFCLTRRIHLDEGLKWAQMAVGEPGVGEENFQTLGTLAQLQMLKGQDAEATRTVDRALTMGGVTPFSVHTFGRQLQALGRPKDALRVFEGNHKRFAGAWPTAFGLARGYEGVGETAKAVAAAKRALPTAPDEPARRNIQAFIDRLGKASAAK